MLRIENLSHRYPSSGRAALSEVSFSVEQGRILGLLGQNGAGKTTLISLLAGTLAVQQGRCLVDGQDLTVLRSTSPTIIGWVPQEYAFYPTLSVRENLLCFAACVCLKSEDTKTRLTFCLDFAQLHDFSSVRADRLSGGLKRRLNLAIALLASPQILLLDEPTANVDAKSRAFLLASIKKLAATGITVVYTSHYIEEIESIADDIVILDQGRVVRTGTLSTLLAKGTTDSRTLESLFMNITLHNAHD